MQKSKCCDVMLYVPTFSGGGAERVFVRIANFYVAEGYSVSFVVNRAGGPIESLLSPDIKIIEAGYDQSLRAIPALIRVLRHQRPRAVISALTSANLAMVIAVRLARLSGVHPRLMICERNEFTTASRRFSPKKRRIFRTLVSLLYPLADKISGNASGVVDDLKDYVRASDGKFCMLPNPAPDAEQIALALTSPPPHPWFTENIPVAVAMGRLVAQKDYPMMLKAIAECKMPVRLLILGQGEERSALEELANTLGIQDRVDFVGFQMNRFDYLAHGKIFLLSSHSEGFPNALIEAISFGLPCVSTDCAGNGPKDILGQSFPEMLVPVGDYSAMAQAISDQIQKPTSPSRISALAERYTLSAISNQFMREVLP
ncbi:glycosyltransferase [Celeribacter halophilus]|uniref:glycosyltransferase n=1 Tax=Celeribacter halophilus TaxID=576117 RepID=UPI003A94B640